MVPFKHTLYHRKALLLVMLVGPEAINSRPDLFRNIQFESTNSTSKIYCLTLVGRMFKVENRIYRLTMSKILMNLLK